MADITDLPVYTPTPEEKAAYEQQFGPPPINPIRDLTSQELVDLQVADKDHFDLVSSFRQNKDLWGDQSIIQKVADANNLLKQRGFSFSDLPTPTKALGMAWDVAKGFGKQLWNYGTAAVTTGMGIAADVVGSPMAREFEQEAQRRVAESIAGSEQAVFGLAETGKRALEKTARATRLSKPLTAQTPEERVADLWSSVGIGEIQEDISKGKGGFLEPVGGEVIRELEAGGRPIRPEETTALAAGDPFSFYAFGKAFQVAGDAARAAIPARARAAATQFIEKSAEKTAGAATQATGKLTEIGGKAVEVAGKAAPIVSGAAAIASGEPLAGLAILGGGTVAGRTAQAIGRGAQRAGQAISEVGKQVSGKPVVSPIAQVIKDVAAATPGAIADIAGGTASDLGLAAVSSETPQQTEASVGIGTVLGAAGAARRVGKRVLSGQLIAPREYGVNTPVASSGNFPAFDAMHSTAFQNAAPGVRARLNAVREFVKGAGDGTDVFLAPDKATLEKTLVDAGVPADTAKTFAEQEGFFTASLRDRSGKPRRVIIANNVEATPHESFHAIQDVLGESANRVIDDLVKSEYGAQWDAKGNRYAQRLVPGDQTGRAWEEVILDESGWGLDAAKEKIYSEIHNRLEAETGAVPTDAQVRDLADPELVRIFNEAQQRNPGASPDQFWREVLSPQEAKAEADRYIARELAAENFDAIFKARGAGLQPTGLIGRLSNIVGNLVSTLGGEPLAGRRTEIGKIEPRFQVAQKVAEAARGQRPTVPTAPPAAPKAAAPKVRGGGPQQSPADEARKIADEAPDVPTERGTKSPRELLGQVAEAIAQQAGVKINYLSAPGEPAAATTSNRAARRDIIETFRSMPPSARALWEKSFFPERVVKRKSGYQVIGWAPEVFASNAHKLARSLADLPTGQELVPYELDATNKTFTEAGWKQLFEDAQTFVKNQMAGQTGAGEPLVVPQTVTERGFFAPASTPGRATALEQGRADFINMLFNFRLPDTPRVAAGKLPLNIAGQEVSIATAGGPQRLSVPVEPRAPFSGEAAQQLGIEGRSILEVNPARANIEAAFKRAGAEVPSFIEAVQRLNLENIKEVELAPELPQFRGNTLTLTAGFQPSANPRAVKAAAVRDERGRVFEGAWHGEAMDRAFAEGASRDVDLDMGFVTNSGEYLSREQALARAEELKQVKPEEIRREAFGEQGVLEAEEFKALRQFQPAPENVQRVIDMPAEEWRTFTQNFKGRFGSGLTGFAYELGANTTTPDQALALKSASEQLRELARQIPPSLANIDQKASLVARAQAFREAYEAATGETIEGTGAGSAVAGIRKYYDPNYSPPVAGPASRESMVAKFQAQPTAVTRPNDEVRSVADKYAKAAGIDYTLARNTVPVNEPLAKEIADLYESLQHDPTNPEVKASYNALAKETADQYKAITDAGYKIEPWTGSGEPYKSSAEMTADVRDNKHLWFLPTKTDTFGTEPGAATDNLMLAKTGVEALPTVNDMFRAVHDFFGHAKEGHQFGPKGELNAWRVHSEMYTPDAQGALAAETLAQNSWVNYGKHLRNEQGGIPTKGQAGYLGPTERPFAEQKNAVIPAEIIARAKGQAQQFLNNPFKAQAQATTEGESFKLRKPSGGFSKAWILPNGEPVQLGGQWHHDWLNDNPDVRAQYNIPEATKDASSRVAALKSGFARVNYQQNGGRLTVEARAADWPKLKEPIRQFIETNLDSIDNLRIELLNSDVSGTADSESVAFHRMSSDAERLAAIPFLETAPSGTTEGGLVTGIAQARARQFQPEGELPGLETPKRPKKKEPLAGAQVAAMNQEQLREYYPEAVVPNRRTQSISSDILNSPLAKSTDNPEQAFADKLVEFARSVENTPEYQMGKAWYSEFATQLKERFGDDARIFAELLAATSPQTSVGVNYKFALDALEGFKTGRFKPLVKKYEQGLQMIADNRWRPWYDAEVKAGRVPNPPAKPGPSTFLEHWIARHNLKPRQSNGALFGINSVPVLQVMARRWLESSKGPKTKNFVENLLGEAHDATIDVWADRTLRRLGYEGFVDRWRILPLNKSGVTDADFYFSQAVFRNAAKQLGLKPDALQAAIWFAEKQHWADNGWVRLDLGDFREEMKKTEKLRSEIRSRTTPPQEPLEFENLTAEAESATL